MLTGSRLAYPRFRVLAATPMDGQADFASLVIHVNDNVSNQSSEQLLACAHGNAGRVPRHGQVARQVCKGIGSDLDSAGLFSELTRLQFFDALECLLPALLQLCRDETIVRVTCRVT